MGNVYQMVKQFKRKYPSTICWRLWSHSKLVETNLNEGEEVYYAFAAQKNDSMFDILSTCVVALTNKRILIAQKRVVFGYFYTAITPDMFNDFKIKSGIFWGKAYIDTIKELVSLSNISKRALPEIETKVTDYMMEEKKKLYGMGKKPGFNN
ncbi:MAG: PH domain-containing protein [Bacilli bacterium]|nr:PH domain-containing protein [Bacilli bacterium]